MAEMQYHQIRLYPFESDEHDSEELALNERINVCLRLRPDIADDIGSL
jgi:septin 3/9/12